MKTSFAGLALTLTLCGCAGRDLPPPVLAADASMILEPAPPPEDLGSPLPDPMLPDLACLSATGAVALPPNTQSCRGAGWSGAPKNMTPF